MDSLSIAQEILFGFAGVILVAGIISIFTGRGPAIITAVFFFGSFLASLAGFDPDTITKAGGNKDGWSIERHQPGDEERDKILEFTQDQPSKKVSIGKKKFVKAAKERSKEERSAEDYLVLATESWRAKEYDEALKYAYKGLDLNPENIRVKATVIHRIGSVYDDLKNYELAIKFYSEAINMDKNFAWPHGNLGILYKEQGKLKEAEEEYKRAIELDPTYASAHNNLGILYEGQGKIEEAERKYKKTIELDPSSEIARRNLERVLKKLKDKNG